MPTADSPDSSTPLPPLPSHSPLSGAAVLEEGHPPSKMPARDYIEAELHLRNWWHFKGIDWSDDRVRIYLRVRQLEVFLAFCRQVAIHLQHLRQFEVRHLPVDDEDYPFVLQLAWNTPEDQNFVEEALASAFWILPL